MNKKLAISVVIPAYNEEKLIGRCVKAVSTQTLPREDYEILVVDNNSTDKTAEIAKSLGARVLFYDKAQGFAYAKQYGSSQAGADIIAYTDADSIPDTEWLATIAKIMENPKYHCIGGSVFAADGNPFIKILFYYYDLLAQINQFFGISLIWSPNMSVRKRAFEQIGGWNLRMRTSEDWDFIVRIQKKFGKQSTLYTRKLHVKTSARRQKKFFSMLTYSWIGVFNYCSLFILRKSVTVGSATNIR